MPYILDTCIFNKLKDGSISMNELPSDSLFFATNIQLDELKATRDTERRAALLQKFTEVIPAELLPTETFVADVSHVDCDKLGSGVLFGKIKSSLDLINKSKRNNIQDALIAEVSILNGLVLITSDADLAKVTPKYGGKVIFY